MKKIRKRLGSILLTVAMLLSLLPMGALAAESVPYPDKDSIAQTCASATEVETGSATWGTAGKQTCYVVNSNVTIDTRITVTGDVHLILADGNTLTASKGIYVGSGSSLTIYGQSTGDDAGQLKAKATYLTGYAGIGGNKDGEAAHGNITINGGIITAESVGDAAGIGSGSGRGASDKPNGTITINGGSVTATGGSNGAGIGGGFFNQITDGAIVINGGTVIANGGTNAAGIGSGYSDQQENGRSITISGGNVTATGGEQAAGIGGGFGCTETSITTITIKGDANVTANGGDGPDSNKPGAAGAGIGSGYDTAMTTFISIGGDAVVKATGGNDDNYGAAGIGSGGGTNSKIGGISISGGNVTATGGTATGSSSPTCSGAGIGSGGYSRKVDIVGSDFVVTPGTGPITIDGGTIKATGGDTDAAGIGNGKSGVGGDFSTGENGQAIIYAGSISDKDDTSGWNGIIFQDGAGQVYGDVKLADNLTLESGQTLNVPEGSSLSVPEGTELDTGSQNLTNDGTLTILGTVTGTITGGGAVVRDDQETDSVASYGSLYYSTLEAAITAANSADGGGTVTLLKNATLSTALDEDVTLSVNSGATLTVETTGLTNLASGTLEIKAGGGFKLGTDVLVGDSGALKVTQGSVTMNGNTVTLTENSGAEILSSKTFYLMLGSDDPALNAVIEENATLTVNGTLKAVSGSGTTGSQVTVKGTLDVNGTLTIAEKAEVTVENDGTLKLPAMSKETMGSDTPGEGMKGDIVVKAGGKLKYSTADVLGGDSPLMTLTEGTATLNLGNANDNTNPSVSLTLDGKASVDGSTKALLVASDNNGTIIPIAISVAGTSEATVSENGVLNLVNGSSLTVADEATFTVAENGILEVHSTAKFDDKATVSGKVYVFEANEGTNPMDGANITLTSTGAVYAEKTELAETTITPAQMTVSTEKYTSTSGVGEKTFAKQWTFSCKITLDANSGTLAGGISELWTGTDGKLTAMPGNPSYSGYTFNGWYDAATGGNKVDTNMVFNADTTIYAQWTYTGGSSSGGSSTPTYAITQPSKVENGSLSVSPSRASRGTKVTITVKPDEGYELDTLTVTDKSGKVVELTKVSNGKYTFTMPASQVTIKASFQETASPVDSFVDVDENAWYYQAVKYAVEKGLMSGTGGNTFAPGLTLSRSMIAQMLYALEGKPAVQDSSFTDISSDAWYADAAAWAQSKGIITGYDNGAFGPDDPLTREQLTLILYNYARIKGYNVSAKGDLSAFVDGDSTSAWARESMTWAVGAGLLSGQGMGMLAPTGTATRAEVAQIMMNFCETIAK